jgi:hypothetical protein
MRRAQLWPGLVAAGLVAVFLNRPAAAQNTYNGAPASLQVGLSPSGNNLPMAVDDAGKVVISNPGGGSGGGGGGPITVQGDGGTIPVVVVGGGAGGGAITVSGDGGTIPTTIVGQSGPVSVGINGDGGTIPVVGVGGTMAVTGTFYQTTQPVQVQGDGGVLAAAVLNTVAVSGTVGTTIVGDGGVEAVAVLNTVPVTGPAGGLGVTVTGDGGNISTYVTNASIPVTAPAGGFATTTAGDGGTQPEVIVGWSASIPVISDGGAVSAQPVANFTAITGVGTTNLQPLIMDTQQRLLVNTAHPNSFNCNLVEIGGFTQQCEAAFSSTTNLYVTDVELQTPDGGSFLLQAGVGTYCDGGTSTGNPSYSVFGPFNFAPGGGIAKTFEQPLRASYNGDGGMSLCCYVYPIGTNGTCSIQGFSAP